MQFEIRNRWSGDMQFTAEIDCAADAAQAECQECGKTGADVQRRHQNTAYVDEESNYATLCADCQKDADEYLAERWAEYYAGCL